MQKKIFPIWHAISMHCLVIIALILNLQNGSTIQKYFGIQSLLSKMLYLSKEHKIVPANLVQYILSVYNVKRKSFLK